MFFNCKICDEWTIHYVCKACNRIRDMVNLYTKDTVLEVLENVLVRDTIKRNYKIKSIKRDGLTEKIEDNNSILCDTSNDREYKKKEDKEDLIIKKVDVKTLNTRCIKELKQKLDTIKE